MALIAEEPLAGYILEEALAYLLSENGYRLLRSASDDKDSLTCGGNGLQVRGRGAPHQADALGELLVPVPFSLPIRLFLEAKHRSRAVSLADVRNAHGVVSDVNEHYSTAQASDYEQPFRRFQYRYVVFSTAGFTRDAQTFALAQQISLVDLSGPAFEPLRTLTADAAVRLRARAAQRGLDSFPVQQVRDSMRAALAAVDRDAADAADTADAADAADTADQDTDQPDDRAVPPFSDDLAKWAAGFTARLHGSVAGEGLVLGFPPAPFILAMRPGNLSDFAAYVSEHGPDIAVDIAFGGAAGRGGDWRVTPSADPDAFVLSFLLPGALEAWLLSGADGTRRAADVRRDLLYSISLFLEDRLIRLLFEPVPPPARDPDRPGAQDVRPDADAVDAYATSYLRQARALPEGRRPDPYTAVPPATGAAIPDAPAGAGWTAEAAAELMRRLDAERHVQADLIRAAARGDGRLSRADVYEIAGFPDSRTLRGLTRPPNRITGQLVESGAIPDDAPYPFQTWYARGVRATHFLVPEQLVALLRDLPAPLGLGAPDNRPA